MSCPVCGGNVLYFDEGLSYTAECQSCGHFTTYYKTLDENISLRVR